MKGKELIRQISEADAFDDEIIVNFKLNDERIECSECGEKVEIELDYGYVDNIDYEYKDGRKTVTMTCYED